MLGKDEYFGTDTRILAGAAPVNPGGSTTFPGRKQAALALQAEKAASLGLPNPAGEGVRNIPTKEVGQILDLIAFELTLPNQKVVPHISSDALARLTGLKADDRLAEELDVLIAKLDRGIIGEDGFINGLKGIGDNVGYTIQGDLDEAIDEIRELVDGQVVEGEGMWTSPFDSSTEATVYRSPKGYIYKVMELIPTEESKISLLLPLVDPAQTLTLDSFSDTTPFLGPDPSLLLKTALNNTPGFVETELVGITESGQVVFKQLDVGDTAPTLSEIQDAILGHGHMVLERLYPNKPAGMKDFDAVPALVNVSGEEYIVSDLRPANARKLKDGQVVFIDYIARKKTPGDKIKIIEFPTPGT